jgi:alkanesulfonate monooxygenase SsuD/methylene tetrahydromethanopterin reductase-like flavin-dependent oxidoreductase (luciferase family)
MRLGALLGPVTAASQPDFIANQARMLQSAGYSSLWSAQAIGRGFMITDPFVTLSVAAAVTEGVELGTAVLQASLYHPADLAHRVLSLSQITGDRLILGLGAGSTEADFKAYGRDYATRFATFRAMQGPVRDFLRSGQSGETQLSPWPDVLGRVKLFLGTWGKGVERAAREFDGWIASGHYRTPPEVAQAAARYRAAGGGRAIVSTLILNKATDLGELKERLLAFAAAGFDDAVVMFHPGAPSVDAVRKLV